MIRDMATLDGFAQDAVDHRRDHRRPAERLLALAEHFAEPDRLLFEHVYLHGRSLRELARITRCSEKALQRRMARLRRRTGDPLFQYVVRQGDLLPRELRAIARRAVLEGRSQRAAAATLGLSLHQVREHLRTLRVLAHAGLVMKMSDV